VATSQSSSRSIDSLSKTDLLEHLPEAVLREVAAACTWRTLEPGEVLFREGDPSGFVLVVASGLLDAFKQNAAGEPIWLRTLGPGEMAGLTSMALEARRSATLKARELAELLMISHADFERLGQAHPELNRSLIASLSRKLRGKNSRLAALSGGAEPGGFRVAVFDAKPYDRRSFEAHAGHGVTLTWIPAHLDAQTADLASGHGAVCAFVNDDLSRPTLERLAQLGVRLVALRCAGYNNVDLRAAEQLGISVARVPAYSPHAVAEHAIALILALNRKTHRAFNRVRDGNFSLSGLVGFDLYGRTAGVVGLGMIGKCCAEILRGFGMRVLATDVRPDAEFAQRTGVEMVTLDALLAQSDVVTLHTPLVPETFHLIGGDRIALMKRGVMLINTSRGALVDTSALIAALKSGQVGAAGLDVYEEESEYFFEDRSDRTITDDVLARLMTFNNVLITSHQAFLTEQALANIAQTTLANIREYISGKSGSALSNAVVGR
jgi:D-lactate dehydrogenase